jgi:hypothetical protein
VVKTEEENQQIRAKIAVKTEPKNRAYIEPAKTEI